MHLTLEADEIRVTIQTDRHESETMGARSGRWVFAYTVTIDPDGDAFTFAGSDLRSGSCTDEDSPNLGASLATLLHFLAHGAEQYAATMGTEPEDGWTFTAEQSERLYAIGADELTMLADETASGR
jgi:hypothetical protein